MDLSTTIFRCFYFSVIFGCVISSPTYRNDWSDWKEKFGKVYASDKEESFHRSVWIKNYRYVKQHNKRTDTNFKLSLNHLADQLPDRPSIQIHQNFTVSNTNLEFVPSSWDWRQKGAIGPVQNQGQLGDVITIVAAECVESYGVITTGQLVSVSEAEVHDCCVTSPTPGSDVFQCIHNIGGLCSASSYPKIFGSCKNNTCSPIIQIHGSRHVTQGDETALMEAVYTMPVFALVDASHVSFQLYRSGIYSEPQCSSARLDHALQVVGYGSQNGNDYWICKNSWGTNWGDRGYILIARNKGNMCGIATAAMYPV